MLNQLVKAILAWFLLGCLTALIGWRRFIIPLNWRYNGSF